MTVVQVLYRFTSLIRNCASPQCYYRALDIVLLYGPMESQFLLSEVPLYSPPVLLVPPLFRVWVLRFGVEGLEVEV